MISQRVIESIHWLAWVGATVFAAIGLSACSPSYDRLERPPAAAGTALVSEHVDLLIVKVQLNGIDAMALIDSGLPFNLLRSADVTRYGLTVGGAFRRGSSRGGTCGADASVTFGESFYVAERLELGDALFRDVSTVTVVDGPSPFASLPVDLVIGAGVLVEMDWQIDQKGRRITFFPLGSRAKPAGAAALAIDVMDTPITPFRLGVIEVEEITCHAAAAASFRIDTGASAPIVLGAKTAGACGLNPDGPASRPRLLGGFNGVCLGRLLRAPSYRIAMSEFEDVVSLVLPESAPEVNLRLMGMGFFASLESAYVSPQWYLRSDQIRSDYGRLDGPWVALEPPADASTTFGRPVLSFGFDAFVNADGLFEIGYVNEGLSAEREGLMVGQRLIAVDGLDLQTPAGQSYLETLDEFGETAEFTVLDAAGGTRIVTLTLESLL